MFSIVEVALVWSVMQISSSRNSALVLLAGGGMMVMVAFDLSRVLIIFVMSVEGLGLLLLSEVMWAVLLLRFSLFQAHVGSLRVIL
jgi:hypothetical protein